MKISKRSLHASTASAKNVYNPRSSTTPALITPPPHQTTPNTNTNSRHSQPPLAISSKNPSRRLQLQAASPLSETRCWSHKHYVISNRSNKHSLPPHHRWVGLVFSFPGLMMLSGRVKMQVEDGIGGPGLVARKFLGQISYGC